MSQWEPASTSGLLSGPSLMSTFTVIFSVQLFVTLRV